MKLCKCGCGGEVKMESSNYCLGHHNRDPEVKEKKRKAFFDKYGVSNPNQSDIIKEKKRKTLILNYRVDNPSKSKEIQQKKISTSIRKWGVDSPNKSDVIKEKKRYTCKKNFGVDYPMESKKVQEKSKSTFLSRYGVDNFSKTIHGRQISRENYIRLIENQKLNGDPLVPRVGDIERKCLDQLQNNTNYNIIRQNQILGYFPDGYIKELNIVIEFDEKWHEYKFQIEKDIQKDQDYQRNNFKCFRIKQKEWEENKDHIISEFKKTVEKPHQEILSLGEANIL